MVLSAYRPPHRTVRLRGPGQWSTLDPKAFRRASSAALPGALLDVGRWPGFAALLGMLAASAALSADLFQTSPYQGACALLGSAALLPLFCTGRAAELPRDELRESRLWLRRLYAKLRHNDSWVARPVGRHSITDRKLDEMRLSLTPTCPVGGLLGLEVGLEFREGLSGSSMTPVVVVRAADGSNCYRALPRSLTWTRGRSPDERAALVRPKLPTAAMTAELLGQLLGLMGVASAQATVERRKPARSSGKGLSTANAATRSSPAHAT
jgi:hypothetical protein